MYILKGKAHKLKMMSMSTINKLLLFNFTFLILVIALVVYNFIPDKKQSFNAGNPAVLHLQQILSNQINQYLGAKHTTVTMTDASIVIEVEFETDIQVSDKDKEKIIDFIQKSTNTEDKLIEIRTAH